MEPQPEIEEALAALVAQLREAAGANLLGVALYGGLAKGRFTPGVLDVNVLVVLAVTLETLLRLDGIAVPADRPGLLRLAARDRG